MPDSNNLIPLLISTSDIEGGAARAAYRLHRALVNSGVPSRFAVATKRSDDTSVIELRDHSNWLWKRLRIRMEYLPLTFETASAGMRSPAWVGSVSAKEIAKHPHSLVNLHWICGAGVSIEQIGKIKSPVVMTLHDMWSFSGTEHYSDEERESGWRNGFSKTDGHYSSVDQWTWKRKQGNWGNIRHAVAPSNWMAQCARQSKLMRDWKISVIPNPVDLSVYRPIEKQLARELLGIPLDAKVVLFGALGGASDRRKGFDLLVESLKELQKSPSSTSPLIGVVFGQGDRGKIEGVELEIKWLGRLNDDLSLALAYSAADVTVVPSRQDNLPQCAVEAHACGCPVVAFRVGGLVDIVDHCESGYLANAFDTQDFAHGVEWCLKTIAQGSKLNHAARQKALQQWSPENVARKYCEVYKQVIADSDSASLS